MTILAAIISFLIGGYDGFYCSRAGTFLILLYILVAKMDIKIASGNTKMVCLASNIGSLIVFILNGKVLFPLGVVSGGFCILGHYIGLGPVINKGIKIIR